MAENQENHLVDIPAVADNKESFFPGDSSAALLALQHHPLTQISASPGHLLLLKLWQRDEELHGRRSAALETRMDTIKRDAFQLCCLFFTFHGLFLTLLFTASLGVHAGDGCRNWWLPSCLSLVTSLVLVCAVQTRLCAYWNASRRLHRERTDGRALARCMLELRMKGASFELSKEPQTSKRMKSSSVEVKWRPLQWCSQNLVTICLVCFTGLLFPTCKFILCG